MLPRILRIKQKKRLLSFKKNNNKSKKKLFIWEREKLIFKTENRKHRNENKDEQTQSKFCDFGMWVILRSFDLQPRSCCFVYRKTFRNWIYCVFPFILF